MNAWLAWTQAAAHLCFSIGAGLMSGMAQLTRPTPPAAPEPELSWPVDGEPVLLPADDAEWNLALAQITFEWREEP